MLLGTLALIAVALTCTMFATRQSMLGFACGIFWGVTSAHAYTLSTVPWGDAYYYIFFASAGMLIFTIFASFGVNEKRDTYADHDISRGEGKMIDEGIGKNANKFESMPKEPKEEEYDSLFRLKPKEDDSKRTRELHERSEMRRKGEYPKRKSKWD